MSQLTQTAIDHRFAEVRQAVDQLWNGEEFVPYEQGRAEQSILEEYAKLNAIRCAYWKTFHLPPKRVPFREGNCLSFAHSLTDETYNSTCIQVGRRRFLALEGPTEERVSPFLDLLHRWRAAFLVSLTDANDPTSSYPYWVGRLTTEGALTLPENAIPFHLRTDWKDRHCTDPERLLHSVATIRESIAADEIIAIHCTAGVGRTGTLATTLCLIDALEEGSSPSIGSLVLYLNLFRPLFVSNPSQYLSLYRTLDHYLQ